MTSGEELSRTLELVRSAQSGNTEAVEELLARLLPRIRQIVALRLGKPVGALENLEDDLVQETLVSAWQNLDRFDLSSEGSFRHWIATIAVNKIRDAVRRNGREHRLGVGALDGRDDGDPVWRSTEPTPSQHAVGRETDERVERALLSLPTAYREVVVCRDIAGMTYDEVARGLGREPASVRKVYQRAWAMVRKDVGED